MGWNFVTITLCTPRSIKRETPYSWWYLCQILTDFQNSLSGWFFSKFAVTKLLQIPPQSTPCVCCQTTLWNKNVRKQTTNDKLQGSVATYLRWGGVVNNQIEKSLLLSLPVKKTYKIGEYSAKLQARRWLSHALCAQDTHTAKSRRTTQSTFLPVSMANIYWFKKKIFTGRLRNKPGLIWLL